MFDKAKILRNFYFLLKHGANFKFVKILLNILHKYLTNEKNDSKQNHNMKLYFNDNIFYIKSI